MQRTLQSFASQNATFSVSITNLDLVLSFRY